MQILRTRPVWVLVIVLLALLLLTGVAYAVGNLLGYIYVPQANAFFPAGTTLVIQQPVIQQHDGRSVTVTQGLASPDGISLWLDFSDTARPVDGAVLKTPDGKELALVSWEYAPNEPNSHGIMMRFAALPPGTVLTTLSLPEGWQLPLAWTLLASAQRTESVSSTAPTPLAATPTATIPPIAQAPCVTSHQIQLCVLSATQSAGMTIVLLEGKSLGGQLTPGQRDVPILIWQDYPAPLTLVDAQGNILPLESARPADVSGVPAGAAEQLTFSGVPADGQPVKLSLPGFYASMSVNQSVSVDLGKDPQPGTLPVDSDIQVFGQTLHFRKGTLDGDGTTSLRLYLNSEPFTIQDGIEPYSLQLGKPERVDDLYGAGALVGGKGLFVELVQSSGKLTGQLALPIISASAIIHGPFVFDITASSTPLETITPLAVDPNNFTPAPTATPLALDSYAYTGQSLNTGDLLYTVFVGDNTQVYAFGPGTDKQPRLVVTLPGAVSQLYIHPDRLGLDYLAGTQAYKENVHYIDYMRLYTLRFSDPAPRPLYSFTPNPDNLIGTWLEAEWSFDGRYAIFNKLVTTPGGPGSSSVQFIWFDLSCRADANCVPHDIVAQPDMEIDSPRFAPDDYQVIFNGVGDPLTGKHDIFALDFDPQKPDNALVNISANLALADGAVPPPSWSSDKKVFSVCGQSVPSDTNTFCMIDPATRSMTAGEPISPNLGGYRLFGGLWLSPTGKQLAAIVFPVKATQTSVPELRLLDLDGHLGVMIAKSQSLNDDYSAAFSPSGQYLAYRLENGQQVEIFDTTSGTHIPVYNGAQVLASSWLGWVR